MLCHSSSQWVVIALFSAGAYVGRSCRRNSRSASAHDLALYPSDSESRHGSADVPPTVGSRFRSPWKSY